jgi:hypothetical protein
MYEGKKGLMEGENKLVNLAIYKLSIFRPGNYKLT